MQVQIIPDGLVCFKHYDTYYTHYVKASSRFLDDALDFHYISGDANNAYLNNVRVHRRYDLSIDALINKIVKNCHSTQVERMCFSELPEPVKEVFRKFEPWAKLNPDVVDWHVSWNNM